jgi:CRP/FNR family transcriptional regulator, cyclic AMP receptor protein
MSADLAMLANVPLFQMIDDQERATLARLLDSRSFIAGQTIFHQGEPGDEVYIVRHGRVQIFTVSDTGQRLVLGENGKGDVFGEISLFDGGPRTATAIAVDATDVLTLDRVHLLHLIRMHPHVALDLLAVMGARLRGTDLMLRTQVARNVNEESDERITFGERIADRVATFGGSWTFIMSFATVLISWVVLNSILLANRPFDPYPYILLNLFLSMLAAIQAPVIMMSQNRQATKDRLKADLDYEVNLKAELEIAQLHRKLDHMTERFEAHSRRTNAESPGQNVVQP